MLDERVEALAERIAVATRSLEGIDHRRARLETARTKTESLAALAERLSGGVATWASEAGEAHSQALEALSQVEKRMTELRTARAEAGAKLDDARARAQQEDLARSELKVRRRILEAGIREQWGIEPEALVEKFGLQLLSPEDGRADGSLEHLISLDEVGLEARKLRLQRQLSAMGNVNPLAAREAKSLGEREAFLSAQIEDVRSSRRDLLKVVETVDEKIQVLFASAFADIAVQFEQLFGMLFPQGRGKLRLTDPHDMLRSGVEVEAGPTGRNLKRLSLLSGGERALSALAVLFAIFRARPSPFYILDEVEAALDDVNLHRFLELLTQFRDSSQLVVVTHQKRTMEVADVLYGVAIRPDGVSKVISERLTELFSA
jgi:chromosome segregation protein